LPESLPQSHAEASRGTTALDRLLFCLTVLATLALSLTFSANRLMWNDEFLSFVGDSLPTARQVVDVQLHTPISLDPPAYHLLSHFAMGVFGRGAIALRLPALCGFLLMEFALFALVRRVAGGRAAVIASVFPLMTASFRYSAEGRPYGLLLGLYASAFACWLIASRGERMRPWALAGLAASIAVAITSHYFGVLIVIPVAVAELARVRERGKWDTGMAAAIVVGFLALGIDVPFQKGLAPYRTHYYITKVSVHAVTQGYRELFIRYTTWPIPVQKVIALVMVVLTVALLVAAWRRFKARPVGESAGLWAGLAGLAMLPFFGFLLGRFVTHTMEVRYVIAALLAFAIAFALVMERRLRSNGIYVALYAVMLLVAVVVTASGIRAVRDEGRATLASRVPSPALLSALAADPGARIYTQSLGDFYTDVYYGDPALRGRFALLYDEPREVGALHHNTNAVTAVYMERFTTLPMVPYADFLAKPHPLLLDYGSGWEWVKKDLETTGVPLAPVGPAMGGELYRVGK
jgi:4-amino-4-deoxy-L-arabinose transferase-like glycosyltransferase